mmetsp:Transcript_5607/g.11695  ORF Transcript_5607/g.11695 Transcript_5607/m.11695 type:complete len:98 (-) Transcript_5607:102-395(-)
MTDEEIFLAVNFGGEEAKKRKSVITARAKNVWVQNAIETGFVLLAFWRSIRHMPIAQPTLRIAAMDVMIASMECGLAVRTVQVRALPGRRGFGGAFG